MIANHFKASNYSPIITPFVQAPCLTVVASNSRVQLGIRNLPPSTSPQASQPQTSHKQESSLLWLRRKSTRGRNTTPLAGHRQRSECRKDRVYGGGLPIIFYDLLKLIRKAFIHSRYEWRCWFTLAVCVCVCLVCNDGVWWFSNLHLIDMRSVRYLMAMKWICCMHAWVAMIKGM